MVKYWTYHHEDVEYYRFTVYRMNKNVQTVYAYYFDGLLIDTAMSHARSAVCEIFEHHKVDRIVLTHHHEDHSGNVAHLMKHFNIHAYAHPLAVAIIKKGYKVSPLATLVNGEVERAYMHNLEEKSFHTPRYTINPIYSPGHCNDHYCFHVPERGWLFSGDIYVADKIKYFVYYEDFGEQIASLKKLIALDFDTLFCSHNPKTKNGKQHLKNKLQFFEDFYGNTIELYKKGLRPGEILKTLGMKENNFYAIITLGNFTAINMVHSALKTYEKESKM